MIHNSVFFRLLGFVQSSFILKTLLRGGQNIMGGSSLCQLLPEEHPMEAPSMLLNHSPPEQRSVLLQYNL